MDNFMEQPTYKMNEGAILTQGWCRLVWWLQRDDSSGFSAYFLSSKAARRRQASSMSMACVSISHSA
ncbi:hypothetical protein EIY72_15210 [Pseudomonas vancouverensis]|uniref:Uncharacterized protein n=1 Tax=Pseudomonas vancouverensis TaxID=95300 RepID=A0A4R4K3X6_PSEVA|nr:hypothetical protein F7R09_25475 [Pseudomonas vancouverensis]TDB62078.1 hypothetical protein EIY72_15210 [Pseudomonas vancouverensis]